MVRGAFNYTIFIRVPYPTASSCQRRHAHSMSAHAASSSTAFSWSRAPQPSHVDDTSTGTRWYRFNVEPCELRLDITLMNGQCFSWTRIDSDHRDLVALKESNKKKRSTKRKRNEQEEHENEDASTSSHVKVESVIVSSSAASSAASPLAGQPVQPIDPSSRVPLSSSDPHYIGILGRWLVGLRQTSDDILYTIHHVQPTTSSSSSSPPTSSHASSSSHQPDPREVDTFLRDYFHLPFTFIEPSDPNVSHGVDDDDAASLLLSSQPRHSDKLLSRLYADWSRDGTERFKFLANIYPGVRLLRSEPFECLFSFICSSNNNITRITKMLRTLRRHFGEKMDVPKEKLVELGLLTPSTLKDGDGVVGDGVLPSTCDFYIFPTLESLLKVREDELRSLGFGYRAKYIVETSKTLHSKGGPNYLYNLRNFQQSSRLKVRTCLEEFQGIGPKVASCIALFSLDRFEEVPCDTHVWKIAKRDFNHFSKTLEGGSVDLQTVKSLTPKMMEHVSQLFRNMFGEYAGWCHCILFLAELPEFKRKLKELGMVEGSQQQQQQQLASSSSSSSPTRDDTVDANNANKSMKKETNKKKKMKLNTQKSLKKESIDVKHEEDSTLVPSPTPNSMSDSDEETIIDEEHQQQPPSSPPHAKKRTKSKAQPLSQTFKQVKHEIKH